MKNGNIRSLLMLIFSVYTEGINEPLKNGVCKK